MQTKRKHPVWTNPFVSKMGYTLRVSVMLAAGLLLWSLFLAVKPSRDKTRGEELIYALERYKYRHGTLPATDDWVTLRQIGFTENEMERANPQYSKLDNAVYQLVFVSGFDGPYLMWNSRERKWRKGFPSPPNR